MQGDCIPAQGYSFWELMPPLRHYKKKRHHQNSLSQQTSKQENNNKEGLKKWWGTSIQLPTIITKCPIFNNNYETQKKKQESVTYTREKRQATETAYEKAQMTDLAGKDFKTSTIKMFKEQKETMLKEVKKFIKTRSHQIPNTNKEI